MPTASSTAKSDTRVDVKIIQLKCSEFNGEDLESSPGMYAHMCSFIILLFFQNGHIRIMTLAYSVLGT